MDCHHHAPRYTSSNSNQSLPYWVLYTHSKVPRVIFRSKKEFYLSKCRTLAGKWTMGSLWILLLSWYPSSLSMDLIEDLQSTLMAWYERGIVEQISLSTNTFHLDPCYRCLNTGLHFCHLRLPCLHYQVACYYSLQYFVWLAHDLAHDKLAPDTSFQDFTNLEVQTKTQSLAFEYFKNLINF